jgi:hypothetical protein
LPPFAAIAAGLPPILAARSSPPPIFFERYFRSAADIRYFA